ncbi:MAG: cytidylate kinase family protein, partial [archaeon]|nr:cytidylate kinase family protein [archaeon]
FYFIPKAKKVFLDCDLQVRARRILEDKSRKEKNEDLKSAIKNIQAREKSELSRYKKYYNVDPYKPENYEIVIDTTNLTVKQTGEKILEFLKSN